MATTLYGIKNCDTIKKARKWLDEAGIDYRFHDHRADGLDPAALDSWLAKL
nr:ArsC family reductase [Aeromonas sp.]